MSNKIREIKITGSDNISELIILFHSLNIGNSIIKNISKSININNLINILKSFGIEISNYDSDSIIVHGKNIKDWKQPENIINIQSSFRILSYLVNILSNKKNNIFITGHDDFVKLNQIELKYIEKNNLIFRKDNKLPLMLTGNFILPKENFIIDNATKKYSLIFNALMLNRNIFITEYDIKEEYLEHILNYYNLDIKENLFEDRKYKEKNLICCKEIFLNKKRRYIPIDKDFIVPADIEEAFYTIFIGVILNVNEFVINNISCNEFNDDIIKVLLDNGINLKLKNQRILNGIKVVDIHFKNSEIDLKQLSISKERLNKICDLYQFIVFLNIIRKNKVKIFISNELRNSDNYNNFKTFLKSININFEDNKDYFSIENYKNKIINSQSINIKVKNNGKLPLAIYLSNFVFKQNIIYEESIDNLQYIFPNMFYIIEQLNLNKYES